MGSMKIPQQRVSKGDDKKNKIKYNNNNTK